LGCRGRGTRSENPSPTSHRHPVWATNSTPHRSRTYRATFGPVHSPAVGRVGLEGGGQVGLLGRGEGARCP